MPQLCGSKFLLAIKPKNLGTGPSGLRDNTMTNTEKCKKYFHHGEGYREVKVINDHVIYRGSLNITADDPGCNYVTYGGRVLDIVNLYDAGGKNHEIS